MNGRVFAVNRSPVLAWNIEPQLQVPYPDMPAAAAAAISPIVPAASDPYGRCWQNQVDVGTNFPYFGPLYNNSLPPTAYRLQAGCMPNLGQFWPPTPPPDGCGRFDGSNLYFGPPVLRHSENISSNMRSSFQGLGHYSHLVETPKEQNQRIFKRETPISPNVSAPNISICSSGSKSDSFNSCCVDSKLKTQNSLAYSLPKQELLTVSSGHEPHLCAPDIRSSSSMHPSSDKSCFSPSHSLKNTLNFHTSSQDNTHRVKSLTGNQENCNASPLKNVYFSHYESENVNSMHSKNFEKTNVRDFQFENKNTTSSNGSKSKLQPSTSYFNNYNSKKYDLQGRQEFHNGAAIGSIVRGDGSKEGIMLVKEQYKQKTSSFKVKPEKTDHADCKFQKNGSKNSTVVQGPECKSSDVFTIPTSVMHPKIEPSDKYFLPSCSSTASSGIATTYATSSPFLVAKDLSADLRTGVSYQNSIFQNSLSKPWQYNELSSISLDNYFRSQEAAKPPTQNPPQVSSALHISVAQTAPQDIDVLKAAGTLQSNGQPVAFSKVENRHSDDDEVQIIGIQTKHVSSKHEARHVAEKTNIQPTVAIMEPLCLKSEKDPDVGLKHEEISTEDHKNEQVMIPQANEMVELVEKQHPADKEVKSIIENSNCMKKTSNLITPFSDKTLPVKLELPNENEMVISDCGVLQPEETITLYRNDTSSDNACLINADCDIKAQKDISLPDKISSSEHLLEKETETVYCENHGLNLLLKSIEKMTSLESIEMSKSPDLNLHDCKPQIKKPEETNIVFSERSKTRGLDLLSAIAGERLVSEFDVIKIEPNESKPKSDDLCIKSNYPDIKDRHLSEDGQIPPTSETSPISFKTSVHEIQSRLAELKKKYKQKQKELSRLKPKKRFASSYLKGRHKMLREDSDQTSVLSTSDSLNSSICSSVSTDDLQSSKSPQENPAYLEKSENKDGLEKRKMKRHLRSPVKRETLTDNLFEEPDKRVTRRSSGKSKTSEKCCEISEQARITRKNLRSKTCRLKKSIELSLNDVNDASCIPNPKSPLKKELPKDSNSLPESTKNTKVYSLRHSSQKSSRKLEPVVVNSAAASKTISSKRKSDNPKKYMPSKQCKLSETIIAKHLRNRILFDTSCATSDDENFKDGVPDDLYDAMMKCHLGEEPRNRGKLLKIGCVSEVSSEGPLGYPEPKKLNPENLVERQRLLALEDGLFYAGYIKECHSSKRYGIALDGQRGNRLHIFTREELLTQAIVESKPQTSDLPEGTRVCAYWSQQYRCLYPGVVGKAPCPSADWSEPRVFVLFDDGDSGQIPTKNIRLIPPDIILPEAACKSDSLNALTSGRSNKPRASSRGRSPRLRCSTPISNAKNSDTGNENESKESSCASINESSCDDSCFNDFSLSPSHMPEDREVIVNSMSCSVFSSAGDAKSGKHQRKRSRRRTSCRIRFGHTDSAAAKEKSEAKSKRHKKYKDKHRRHHHHHHRHHRHHHHHHHSKKHKHRRKNAKSTSSQDLDYENCIPCNSNLKSFKDIQAACTDLIEHSSTVNLPQGEQNSVC